MSSALPRVPIFEALMRHDGHSIAIVHSESRRKFTYGELLRDVAKTKSTLLGERKENAPGSRVALLVENGYDFVVSLLSVFACNSIAVPLSASFPASELKYILDNSGTTTLLTSEKFLDKADEVVATGLEHLPNIVNVLKRNQGDSSGPAVELANGPVNYGGMMLYTSGTTNRPKGVVLMEPTLTAQALSLIEAWQYSPRDRLLHVLPLHHIHGTVNALVAPLMAGCAVEFMFPFNPTNVWQRLASPYLPASGKHPQEPITFLTAVPTIYNRLLGTHATLSPETQSATKKAISPAHLRLNISGSAALPLSTQSAWTNLSSGNTLLERYGMTEVGMALSCGLSMSGRVDGSVGWPLPSVEIRLVDTESGSVIPPDEEVDTNGRERTGEIQLRGPTIFQEYWRNPEATAAEFENSEDGQGRWFKTGDIACRRTIPGAGSSPEQSWARGPMYFILGRKSVDIIKTGGEKVSALEIERELLNLPQIAEAAVVGLPSEQWGQKVAAIIVLHPEQAHTGRGGKHWGVMDMRRALKDRLVNYKVPQELKVVEGGLPRNAMGKVNKKELLKQLFPDPA